VLREVAWLELAEGELGIRGPLGEGIATVVVGIEVPFQRAI